MSIRKRNWGDGNEAWQVDLLVKGNRVRKQFRTQREAREFELEIRKASREGTYRADGAKTTFADLLPSFEAYLEKRHERGQEMTYAYKETQLGHLRNYIIGGGEIRTHKEVRTFNHGLSKIKIRELTSVDVEKFIDFVIDEGISIATVKKIKQTLVNYLEHARRLKYIAVNPARNIRIFVARNAKTSKKVTVPAKELIARMVDMAEGRFKVYFTLAVLAGVRAGEHRALFWRDVDFVKNELSIERRVDRRGKDDDQGAKSGAGNRTIPLAPELVEDLKIWRSQTVYNQDDDLIFSTKNRTPLSHSNIVGRFYNPLYRLAASDWPFEMPVPRRPRWHDLRHFAVSCWIEAGLPPKAIQEFAGHASLSTTMDIYGHLFPSASHSETMSRIAVGLLSPR